MAFLPPEEQNQQAPQGQTSAGAVPPPTSGGSAGAGAAPKAGSAPSSGTPTQFGSSSSKLGDYLSANAPQITNQANQIAGQLGNQYQQVGTDITNAGNQFGQQVQQGYTAQNQDLVNQAASNPTGFVTDPNNVSGFQAQYNDTYKGPANYESTTPYSNIQNEVNQAVQGAQALGTQGGLSNYFASTGKNPTRASNTLDSLLISGNPEAQKTVTDAANQYNDLGGKLGATVTAGDAQAQAAQQSAKAANDYAHQQIGNTVDQFGNAVNQGVSKAEADRTSYNTALQNAQSQATGVNSALQSFLGTVPNSGITNYYDPVLNMTPGVNPATAANVSTADQYGTNAALAQLLGNDYNPVLNQADAGQAGTYKAQTGTVPDIQSLLGQQDQALANYYVNNPTQFTANRGNNSQAQSFSDLGKYLQGLDSTSKGGEGDLWSQAFQNAIKARG